MKLKILVTGSVGFIGFHLAKKLISMGHEVHGIDNFNSYYDINLKINRGKFLQSIGLDTKKIDISDTKQITDYFKDKSFDVIIHLAAQAGVRYSLQNPSAYIDSNIKGTFNILDQIKNHNIKHFLVASTSSVYGLNKDKKFTEKSKADEPVSLYSATKKSAENLSFFYSYNYKIPITNFRFFTVYGPWGRPDMSLFKFTEAILENKPADVYNDGIMWRDFTYIDDLIETIARLIKIAPSETNRVNNDSLSNNAPYRILNIGNQKSVKLNDFINTLEKVVGKKLIRNNLPMQEGDVPYTLSDCTLLKKLIDYVPSTQVSEGIELFYKWFIEYNNKN